MNRPPEIEITRPFKDPRDRINAMQDFHLMIDWMVQAKAYGGVLLYTNVENGEIVWRFSDLGKHTQAFLDSFDAG